MITKAKSLLRHSLRTPAEKRADLKLYVTGFFLLISFIAVFALDDVLMQELGKAMAVLSSLNLLRILSEKTTAR